MKIKCKICTKCKIEYPATHEYFVRNKDRRDGLLGWCKKCKRISNKKYHQKSIEKINKQRKEWRKNHKEITKIRDKKYREKMKSRKPEDILIPKTKKCTQCEKIKLANEFYKDKHIKDGLTIFCKACYKIINQNGYQKHKAKRKQYGKQYNIDNKEKIAQDKKRYYQNNKVQIQQYKKQWQQDNSEKIAKRHKEWYLNNKEYVNQYAIDKRKNDINYRILCNLRVELWYALKSQNIRKTQHTKELVGCPIDDLRQYIQSLFLSGMTFDNYGRGNKKWSIDHIRPCSSFDLSDVKQQKICFHYTNLRPLWNPDNFHKNSFYNGKYVRKHRKENKNV